MRDSARDRFSKPQLIEQAAHSPSRSRTAIVFHRFTLIQILHCHPLSTLISNAQDGFEDVCDIAHARRLCDRHGMGNPQSKQPARRARAAFQSLHGAPCLWVAGSRGAATNCYLITFHSEVGRTVSQLVAESPDAEAIIGRESRLLENKCIELRSWSSDRVAYFRIQSFGKLSSLGSHRWLAPTIEDLAFEMANECEHERPLIGSGHIFDRFLPNQLLLRAARR